MIIGEFHIKIINPKARGESMSSLLLSTPSSSFMSLPPSRCFRILDGVSALCCLIWIFSIHFFNLVSFCGVFLLLTFLQTSFLPRALPCPGSPPRGELGPPYFSLVFLKSDRMVFFIDPRLLINPQ